MPFLLLLPPVPVSSLFHTALCCLCARAGPCFSFLFSARLFCCFWSCVSANLTGGADGFRPFGFSFPVLCFGVSPFHLNCIVVSNYAGATPLAAGSEESCARAYLDLEEIKRQNEEIRKELLELRRWRLEARARREMMFERKKMLRDDCSGSHVADDIERSVPVPDPGYPAVAMHFDVPRSNLHRPQDNCAFDTLLPDKDPVVVLPKPDPILFGAKKRKAEWKSAALISTDSPMAHFAKKPKGRWVCDLCKVSATSEKGLNDHLQGRKHRLMEAQIRGEEIETGLTKDGESEEAQVRGGQMEVHPAKNEETGTHYVHKAGTGPSGEACFKKATRKTPVKISAPSHGMKAGHAMNAASKKRRFKYWCRMCLIGTDSPVDYASHEKGKKHLALLLKLGNPSNTCLIGSDSPVVYASHEKGKKHLAQPRELGKLGNTN